MQLALERTTDILKTVGKIEKAIRLSSGLPQRPGTWKFMPRKKLEEKHLDIIAANLIGPSDSGFASDTNRMTLFFADGRKEVLDVMDKDAVAHLILDRVAELVKKRTVRLR